MSSMKVFYNEHIFVSFLPDLLSVCVCICVHVCCFSDNISYELITTLNFFLTPLIFFFLFFTALVFIVKKIIKSLCLNRQKERLLRITENHWYQCLYLELAELVY